MRYRKPWKCPCSYDNITTEKSNKNNDSDCIALLYKTFPPPKCIHSLYLTCFLIEWRQQVSQARIYTRWKCKPQETSELLSYMASHPFGEFIFRFPSTQGLFSPTSISYVILCNSQLFSMVDFIFSHTRLKWWKIYNNIMLNVGNGMDLGNFLNQPCHFLSE